MHYCQRHPFQGNIFCPVEKNHCEALHFGVYPFLTKESTDTILIYKGKFDETFVNEFEPYAIEIMRTLRWMQGAHKKFASINFDSACNPTVSGNILLLL